MQQVSFFKWHQLQLLQKFWWRFSWSHNLGIRNSARPTRNENIEIENVSSPSQTLSLIRNLQINQLTLKNQNETLGIKIFQKQTLLVILIQLSIVGQVTAGLFPLMHPVQFLKPVLKLWIWRWSELRRHHYMW